MQLEKDVRVFVHTALCRYDKHYRTIEYIHMDEVTGVISVKWQDREGQIRENKMKFSRKV